MDLYGYGVFSSVYGGSPPIALAGGEIDLVVMMAEQEARFEVTNTQGQTLIHTRMPVQ